MINDIPKEVNGGLVEGKFFGFEEELELSLSCQDCSDMLAMFGQYMRISSIYMMTKW